MIITYEELPERQPCGKSRIPATLTFVECLGNLWITHRTANHAVYECDTCERAEVQYCREKDELWHYLPEGQFRKATATIYQNESRQFTNVERVMSHRIDCQIRLG